MCYGLTRQQTKKLAFEYAEANAVCPDKWKDSKIASEDWLKGFMNRHKDLAVRKPESTSLSRAISFKRDERYRILPQSRKLRKQLQQIRSNLLFCFRSLLNWELQSINNLEHLKSIRAI